jgi:hypothetical protein
VLTRPILKDPFAAGTAASNAAVNATLPGNNVCFALPTQVLANWKQAVVDVTCLRWEAAAAYKLRFLLEDY